jgi:hypothetical protein
MSIAKAATAKTIVSATTSQAKLKPSRCPRDLLILSLPKGMRDEKT